MLDNKDIPICSREGIRFGQIDVIVGADADADRDSSNHVLCLRDGSRENATVIEKLLIDTADQPVVCQIFFAFWRYGQTCRQSREAVPRWRLKNRD